MKQLVRSLMIGLALAVLGGAAPLAAQRVAVEVRIGTPGLHYHGHYRHGHRVYRSHHRAYARWHGRPVIVVAPRHRHYRGAVIVRSGRVYRPYHRH